VLGLASALGGALFALVQDDLKRLLAYDTVSQMGVLTVGLATGRAAGLAGTSYHLINHALFKSILFLCAGSIVHATGATKLSEMGGLARRMPGLAAAFSLGAIAIAGLPPLNGYAGVGLIHDSLLDSRQYFAFGVMVAAQAVTVAALGKATWQAFYRPAHAGHQRDEPLRPGMVTALLLLGAGCLAFGAFPYVLLPHIAVRAAGSLLAPSAYAGDILAGGGHLPSVHVSYAYFNPRELLTVLAAVAAAVPAGRVLLSRRAARMVEAVRRIQTGSVNDYAGYLVVGLLASVAALTIGH
jgi:multicomponent Na+:H+ antiporter subunit D